MFGRKCFIIAEAGTCHADPSPDRRLGKALALVHAASEAGADAVKFQMFSGEDIFCPFRGDKKRRHRWDASVMPLSQWFQVKEYAEALGVEFLASVFDHTAVKWLKELRPIAVKVASRAAENFPYGSINGPYLISTGLSAPKVSDGIYLECESKYPSTAWWKNKYEGFSDHSGNPWRAIEAIVAGCRLIEVHFYVDPRDAGPDLPASLDVNQLRLICEARDELI